MLAELAIGGAMARVGLDESLAEARPAWRARPRAGSHTSRHRTAASMPAPRQLASTVLERHRLAPGGIGQDLAPERALRPAADGDELLDRLAGQRLDGVVAQRRMSRAMPSSMAR